MIEVKICGLARREDIGAAAEAGADYAGIHLDPDSPRSVSLKEAAGLADYADSLGLKAVAVASDPDTAMLEALADAPGFLFLQLNGDETPQDVERAAEITGLRIVKALSAATPEEVGRRIGYEAAHAFVLNPRSEWAILRGAGIARPWFLAGGLTPDNVAHAMHAAGALMAEVTTGVETAPGQKDAALMRAFVDAALAGE